MLREKQMPQKWKIGILLFLLPTIIVTTIVFGRAETNQFSAYAACRKTAMVTKSYGIWKHENTVQMVFLSRVVFSDGYNDLTCSAFGIGPFWIVGFSFQTIVGCATNNGMCPENYFGVSP